VAEKDTKDASAGVMKDLRRFQEEKENDLRRYMVGYLSLFCFFKGLDTDDSLQMEFAQCHIDWARRNQASWEGAKAEIQNIRPKDPDENLG
jgi:hypothetical protein